ncbi:MAG: hypothetical protein CM15mP44_6130 [Candidatus Neomarinimicrobiota bacterium]|nr:MAG: hypothetical protein CM15mP44_6130 [Candidatus Neomarinimicrobiota bacterium]
MGLKILQVMNCTFCDENVSWMNWSEDGKVSVYSPENR